MSERCLVGGMAGCGRVEGSGHIWIRTDCRREVMMAYRTA